jgi:thiol-disulfide isomerase/thioredoxin
MSRPTKIALVCLGIIAVVAIIFSWRGPLKGLPNEVSSIVNNATGNNLPVLATKMPDFAGIARWWNTPGDAPLTAAGLKGKVVLVDFWTYSCINCLRTLPFLKSLNLKYSPYGLVIVGVHTPEFAFEGDPANVDRAIKENGITYPVALDASYGTWNAYNNEYWPADYLFDAKGQLRETNFGEGNYDETEQAVRTLLADATDKTLPPAGVVDTAPNFSLIKTQETYFGLARGTAFMGQAGAINLPTTLTAAATPLPDKWTAGGTWRFESEYVETTAAGDVFRFSVSASKLHLVMSSSDGTDKTIDVFVDGRNTGSFIVNAPDLYTVAQFPDAGRHTVEIRIHDAGVRFYSATFS